MRHLLTASFLATAMFTLPQAAHAQAMTAEEAADLRAQIEALKAQVQTLESRLDAATGQPTPAPVTTPAPAAPAVVAKPATEIVWKGAPEIRTADGWSFKPRGRMQVDVASIDAPAGVTGARGGVGTEFRRIYLGFDGKIPGGFSYRAEADIANSGVELADVYLTYGPGPFSVTAGQIKPFWSLDELTSDLFNSFNERAAFTQAFNFKRRVGLSGQYKGKAFLLQGGIFGDNANDLLSDTNNSVSFDGRVVWMPKWGDTQLHLGGSAHWRNINDAPGGLSYAARPFIHTTDARIVSTGAFTVSSERGLGLEGAALRGPFHAAGEAYWHTARRPTFADPTFFGGYAEVGYVLTRGDSRGYKDGAFDRLSPKRPITEGGPGAIEINARYDHLDLNDAGIVGGRQRTLGVSLVWAPISYVRLTANYGHLMVDDAALGTVTGDRDYSADAFGLRTQFDF
jgi:phosphate-selective porin OprO/OprP